MPPLAIAVTRCRTSAGIPWAAACVRYFVPMAAKTMLIPPEAEPVTPASTVVVTAADSSGLAIAWDSASPAPGSRAAPQSHPQSRALKGSKTKRAVLPQSPGWYHWQAADGCVAVRKGQCREFLRAARPRRPTARRACWFRAAEFPELLLEKSKLCGYMPGIARVSTRFRTPTSSKGRNASSGLGSVSVG